MIKRILLFMGVLILVFLAACSDSTDNTVEKEEETDNLNKTGMPIVKEQIEIDFFTAKEGNSIDIDWNDNFPVWGKYENLTNIKVNWKEQVPVGSLDEKRNLALASDTLPDVFFASQIPNLDLFKYGKQGTFIKLNDLIDEYAPNLKRLMEEDPSIKKGMTFPDGNIYSMPGLRESDFLSIRIEGKPWIDETWVDRLNIEVPETTEEYYEFLTAVKNSDEDVIPYGGVNIGDLVSWLRGAFGLNNTGSDYIDKDPDGDGLRFVSTSDKYREMLEYMHKLYDEKLIAQNIFSIDWDQYLASAAAGDYASTVFWNPSLTIGEKGENFISMSALKGPDGDQLYTSVLPPLFNNGQFVITDVNPDPVATVRWMDYFYKDEGIKLMYMGIKDESYIEEDGKYRYTDEIENAEDTEKKRAEYVPWAGIDPPGVVKADYFNGAEGSEKSLEAAEKIEPYVPKEIWSNFLFTEDENKLMTSIGQDIEKYVDETRDKFIIGHESLDDKNWANYVKTIEDMGLEDYMKVQKEAYERYIAY